MKSYTSFLGKVSAICGAFLPALAFAANQITSFEGLVNKFLDLITIVIPLIFSIALVAFLWGIFQYFFSGAEKKEEARDFLLYGLIGLFIMISVWGLVKILTGTFLLNNAQPVLPTLGTGGGSSGTGGSNFTPTTVSGNRTQGFTSPEGVIFDERGEPMGAVDTGASRTSNTGASRTSETGASRTSSYVPCYDTRGETMPCN